MIIQNGFQIPAVMIAFLCLGLVVIGGLLVMMRLRHKYHPLIIGHIFSCIFILVKNNQFATGC